MIIYLHMHKCAGTSVVRAAIASGLALPRRHQNGNLIDEAGQPVKYRRLDPDGLPALIRQQREDGVQFMAMEWDFPRFEQFDGLGPLRFFTTLRDPLARAISNFRMDKVAGWIDRAMPFSAYINGDALYRSDNYYVKIVRQLWPLDTASEDDLAYATGVLGRFEAVAVIEQHNLPEVLGRFGIAPPEQRSNRFDPEAARETLGDDRVLQVEPSEIRDFIRRNALDYALYTHFTRRIRLGSDAPALEPAE